MFKGIGRNEAQHALYILVGLGNKLVFWMRISVLAEKVSLLFPPSLIELSTYNVIFLSVCLKT